MRVGARQNDTWIFRRRVILHAHFSCWGRLCDATRRLGVYALSNGTHISVVRVLCMSPVRGTSVVRAGARVNSTSTSRAAKLCADFSCWVQCSLGVRGLPNVKQYIHISFHVMLRICVRPVRRRSVVRFGARQWRLHISGHEALHTRFSRWVDRVRCSSVVRSGTHQRYLDILHRVTLRAFLTFGGLTRATYLGRWNWHV